MNQQQKIDSSPQMHLAYLHKLVGIPYLENGRTIDGTDCYGLVCIVYREMLGIDIPSLENTYTGDVTNEDLTVMVESKHSVWFEVTKPIVGDVILFRLGNKRHVGIWLREGSMLHSVNQANTCIERYDNFRWKNNIIGIFRHISSR
jgi:cell wall-associated NlpC family hydrolase